jgi:hypothetical protein
VTQGWSSPGSGSRRSATFSRSFPLALYLQGRTDSGVIVGLLFVALWGPSVVLAGPAGGLVDRIETRRLLLIASLGQVGVVVGLAFVHPTGSILALVVLLGSLSRLRSRPSSP